MGRWGIIALCIWLLFVGMIAVLGLTFSHQAVIMGLMAIAAAILILVGK